MSMWAFVLWAFVLGAFVRIPMMRDWHTTLSPSSWRLQQILVHVHIQQNKMATANTGDR